MAAIVTIPMFELYDIRDTTRNGMVFKKRRSWLVCGIVLASGLS